MARITAFSPGQSPPPVRMPIFILFLAYFRPQFDTRDKLLPVTAFCTLTRIAHLPSTMQVPLVRQERNLPCTSAAGLPPRAPLNRCVQYRRCVQNNPARVTTSNPDSPAENACQLRIPENCRLVRATPERGELFGRKSHWRWRSPARQIPGIRMPQSPPARRRVRQPGAEWPIEAGPAIVPRNVAATIAPAAT